MSWAERMAKPCIKCKAVNRPDEGYVDGDDILILLYLCGKCGQRYQSKIQLNETRVHPLKGMAQKGQANKGGRVATGIY